MKLLIVHKKNGEIIAIGVPEHGGIGVKPKRGEILTEIDYNDINRNEIAQHLQELTKRHRIRKGQLVAR